MPPEDEGDLGAITDVVVACRLIMRFSAGVHRTDLDDNPQLHSAVLYQLLIIGEATKRLSDGFRMRNSDIPWRKIAGMRDILVHAYDHVDSDEVWRVSTQEIPDLLARLSAIVQPDADD